MWDKLLQFLKDVGTGIADGIDDINKALRPRTVTAADNQLMLTTRTETDGKMTVFEGTLPSDLTGVFYCVYPVGSVNSGGLPFQPTNPDGSYNPEYCTPIMNGDGMVLSVSFNGTPTPDIKTRLMKTPCYFADEATKFGTEFNKIDGFLNFGIARMSMALGARDLLNTAVTPVQFGTSNPFLLACYDVGRPYIADPSTLTLQSPFGSSKDWVPGTPAFLPWPFQLVETTAHPSFDPLTKELFTINYCKTSNAEMYDVAGKIDYYLKNQPQKFKDSLTQVCQSVDPIGNLQGAIKTITNFFRNLDHYVGGKPDIVPENPSPNDTSVWMMKWTGGSVIEKWSVTDQDGNPLQIQQCMHQTALTQDYIVLTDTSFKFTMDMMFTNPFPQDPIIDIVMRQCMTKPMLTYTDVYIINRADLISGIDKVTAYILKSPIPVETIHYSCDYDNPDGQITLYGIHNSAACVAEWIRSYDVAKLSGLPVNNELIGMFALGCMDINRFGKWVIDAKNYEIVTASSKQYIDQGKTYKFQQDRPKGDTSTPDIGPNTWTLGLYTFRDMLSPTKVVNKIKYLWFIANGLDPNMLTNFIYDMYADYANRVVPVDQLLALTKQDLPQTLVRFNCDTFLPEESYQFQFHMYIRSPQFIPRPTPTPGVDPGLDGYLFCTLEAGMPQDKPLKYRSEYWVFDATNISQGPVCKLLYDDIQFCFTLHTAWLEEALPYNMAYNVDVKGDYDNIIGNLFDKGMIQDFFNKNVYPQWYKQKGNS